MSLHKISSVFAAWLVLATGGPAVSAAAPVLGFVESFGTDPITTWDSQATLSNPGTGGVLGANDGYLKITRTTASRWGAHSSSAAYIGDYKNANVDRINFWLNDTDANQAFEVHLSIGNSNNLWQYNTGFSPPENSWAQFTVDLTDSSKFTHIISLTPGFTQALRTVDRILIRHDVTPFSQSPNLIAGEAGVDEVELSNTLVGVPWLAGPAKGSPVAMLAPYPNPARGAVACAFEATEGDPVTIGVYDASGRQVRGAKLAPTAGGRGLWMWDGNDDAGNRVRPGVYRVRATGRFGGTSRPVTIL